MRQGGPGLNTDVAIMNSAVRTGGQGGWFTFPRLVLPQYDACQQGSHMYCVTLHRQPGVDNAQGWVWAWLICQPMLDANGAKLVFWRQVTGGQAGFSTSRRVALTNDASGAQSSLSYYFDQGPKIYDGTNYYIVLDCNYDPGGDGSYKWKGNLSRM